MLQGSFAWAIVRSVIAPHKPSPAGPFAVNEQESLRQFKAGIFRALAHPTRIFILESLLEGEMTVGSICERVGISQSNASQHLAVLRNSYVVSTRKEGNSIFYRLRDPRLGDVLDKMREYFFVHAATAMSLLAEEADAQSSPHRNH